MDQFPPELHNWLTKNHDVSDMTVEGEGFLITIRNIIPFSEIPAHKEVLEQEGVVDVTPFCVDLADTFLCLDEAGQIVRFGIDGEQLENIADSVDAFLQCVDR